MDKALGATLEAARKHKKERQREQELQRLHWTHPEDRRVASCPLGYYRTWLIVFKCGGESGQAYILLPPAGKQVQLQEIPEGTVDFQVVLMSVGKVRLILWDGDSHVDIARVVGAPAERAHGTWSGDYRGLHVTFGHERGQPYCKLMGAVPHGISLRVVTLHESEPGTQDVATLRYEYRALEGCSSPPLGCDRFDRQQAYTAVQQWSRALQMRYGSPAVAWAGESKKVAMMPGGIPWHEWVIIWGFDPTWQQAFRLLDTDNDYFISPTEFASGLAYAPDAVPAAARGAVPAVAPTVFDARTAAQPPPPPTTALPLGLTERCPAGYYRSSALLFGCSTGRGVVQFSMLPSSMDKAAAIPKGVKNLRVMVTANVDVDMYLWDDESDKYIVHWQDGVVNDRTRVRAYKGTTFSFSGDDRTTPIVEACNLTGVLQSPVSMRLFNYAKDVATATLYYAYDGLTPCQTVPAGCNIYDRVKAEGAAVLSSQKMHREHSSARDAWNAVYVGKNPLGISWHDWMARLEAFGPAKRFETKEREEMWKMVFRFLDVDFNSHISTTEFKRGYDLADDLPAGLLLTSSAPRPEAAPEAARGAAAPIVIDFPRTSEPATCFDRQFRIDPFVFRCRGSSNLMYWSLAGKSVSEVQRLPIGLTDLSITLNADDDVDLYLWDAAANRYILHWRDGVINDQERSGNYQGLQVSFSGDDKRPPVSERYIFKGRMPVITILRLENFGRTEARITLEYTYSKLDPCPGVPVGCGGFDMARAEEAVRTWSQEERVRYPNANEAWNAHQRFSVHGLTWHNWATVAGSSADWKWSFRYLDTDNNGFISQEEFTTGYGFMSSVQLPPPPPVQPVGRLPGAAPVPGARSPVDDAQLSSGGARHSDAAACPADYYQSAPVVFGCSGGSGSLEFETSPGKVREVMYIPRGVKDVLLQLTADVDVDLYVWDATTSSYIVHWEDGVVSEKVRGGRYHELSVSFSGDDRTPPIHEACNLHGTLARTVSIRLHNRDKEAAVASLRYTYSGLSPCPKVPGGCEPYDAAVAARVAAICSRQLHSYHYSAEGAWDSLVDARNGGSCVPRQNWRAACSRVDLAEMAFRYLDTDNNGCVSQAEFAVGFHMVSGGLSQPPAQKLQVTFPMPNMDYKKLAAEPEVKRHLQDAIRAATVSSCHDADVSAGNVNVRFRNQLLQKNQVEAIITPPPGKTARSLVKYCCSSAWLSTNMRKHVSQVDRVREVFVGRIENFNVSCEVHGAHLEEDGYRQPIISRGFGPVDVGAAYLIFGAVVFAGILFALVSVRSSSARLHTWSLIHAAADIFSAALVFAAISEFVKSLMLFTPLPVHICVDYGLFLCAFVMLQAASALLSVSFSSGGFGRGGSGVASAPIDSQVWVVADSLRSDCDEKIHSHEVRTKTVAKSIASLNGIEVFVTKALFEKDVVVRRIRRYTFYISHLAGFAAMHAGCSLQRLIVETHRNPSAVLIPVLLNQVLLYVLFRAGRFLRSSWRWQPLLNADSMDGLLRDPRREALLDEEILGAEGDIASLACSFLLVQALHYWVAGVVPGLDRIDEELMRPLELEYVLLFLGIGLGLAIMSTTLAHLSIRQQLVAWKRRLLRVWVNTAAMCSAWCVFWAAQWELHRQNSWSLPASMGELAAQLLLASVVTILAFKVLCAIGLIQDRSGPDKMLGVVRSSSTILAVLVGVSWRLVFGAAAEAASEDAPQPAVTRLLFSATAALLVLPAANRQVLSKVMRYRHMQVNLLEARGESALAEALALSSVSGVEEVLRRQSRGEANDDSNVWRFYRRQDEQWQDATLGGPGSSPSLQAKLQVNIMHAKGLRNADWMPFSGKSDPYCTCEIPGKPGSKVTTFVVNDDLNPVWNFTADIMDYSMGDPLVFTVYDSDVASHDLLGRATLLAPQFYPGGFEGDLQLVDAGKAAHPTLTVRVKVISQFQPLTAGSIPPSSSQLSAMSPMRSGGWYMDPSGKDIRPLS